MFEQVQLFTNLSLKTKRAPTSLWLHPQSGDWHWTNLNLFLAYFLIKLLNILCEKSIIIFDHGIKTEQGHNLN